MKQTTVWLFLLMAAAFSFLPVVAGATTPAASFTSNATSGGAPLSVQFIDTSTHVPTKWIWSFGDGGTATTQDPVHTYTSTGTYTVTLTTTNADGSDTVTETGYITVSKSTSAPVAAFLSNATAGEEPLAVQFVDSSSNSPTAWAWSFGDGETSAVQNPVHTYTGSGSFTVTLSAVNAKGSSTVSMAGYVKVSSSSSAPDASFSSTETDGDSPLSIQFIDTSSNAPTSWFWSFGDGNTSASQNPSHTYVSAGTYTVTMTATNAGGSSTVTESDYITVDVTEPVASFEANVTRGSAPLSVQFMDGSANTPTSWRWSFGDGETSTLQNPVHEYTADGSYSVTLKATNDEGSNSTTYAKYINVSTTLAPGTSFTAATTSGIAPFTVQFTDTSTPLPTAWEWSFGDGSTSALQNPSHSYASAGTYTVSLTATNEGGSQTATRDHYIAVNSADSLPAAPAAATPDDGVELITGESTVSPATAATTDAAQGWSGSMLPILGVIALIAAAIAAVILIRRRPPGSHHPRGGNL